MRLLLTASSQGHRPVCSDQGSRFSCQGPEAPCSPWVGRARLCSLLHLGQPFWSPGGASSLPSGPLWALVSAGRGVGTHWLAFPTRHRRWILRESSAQQKRSRAFWGHGQGKGGATRSLCVRWFIHPPIPQAVYWLQLGTRLYAGHWESLRGIRHMPALQELLAWKRRGGEGHE